MTSISISAHAMIPHIRRWSLVLFIGSLLGVLFYTYLHFSETGIFPALNRNPEGLVLSMLTGMLLGAVLYVTNLSLDKWIPWKKHFATRFVSGYLTNIVLAIGISVGCAALVMKLVSEDIFWEGLSLEDDDLLWKTTILHLCSLFIYNALYALLYSYQHYTIAQIENLQNERKQLELQFEALKGQVSPHYLFNSLNTISSLLFKDLPSAEQFIRRLAQTYQYILATQNKKYVLLKEEVEFVNSYYYLLRIRFQQQLDVEINLPAGIMNSKIPPLTLQMLVENAVKHNSLSGEKKLFIYITAQDNKYLKVINTKTSLMDSVSSFKVGLENIRKRYQFFTDETIMVKDDEKFTVSLPVIQNRPEHEEQKYSA
jgi:two-component system, LytTR family, sensor kinase